MNNRTEIYKKSICAVIGFMPTEQQRDQWLCELELQWNCKIVPAKELSFDYQLSKERQEEINKGIAMKLNTSNSYHISAIWFGADDNEKRWNMLESFLDKINLYAKIVNNKAIAIFYPKKK